MGSCALRADKSIPSYIRRSLLTILRIFVTYRPFAFFASQGAVVFSLGFLLGLRFLFYFAMGDGNGRVQSLILAALLMGIGFSLGVVGLLADLIAVTASYWRNWSGGCTYSRRNCRALKLWILSFI